MYIGGATAVTQHFASSREVCLLRPSVKLEIKSSVFQFIPDARSTAKVTLFAIFLTVVVVVVDRFYIALFSALELTHCARM